MYVHMYIHACIRTAHNNAEVHNTARNYLIKDTLYIHIHIPMFRMSFRGHIHCLLTSGNRDGIFPEISVDGNSLHSLGEA